MSTDEHTFPCGPTKPSADPDDATGSLGRIPPDRLTLEDRAAVANFAGFLRGDLWVCPACMDPDDACRPAARCCTSCAGVHITARPGAKVRRRVMDGAT